MNTLEELTDACRASGVTLEKQDYVRLACISAELVLPIWTRTYPDDDRPDWSVFFDKVLDAFVDELLSMKYRGNADIRRAATIAIACGHQVRAVNFVAKHLNKRFQTGQ